MRFKIKPIVAGAVAGGVLAVGGIAAFDAGTQSADAQSSGSVQAQLNDIKAQQTIIQRQNIRAIKQANTYSEVLKYFVPQGQRVGVQTDAPNQAAGEGTNAWPTVTLQDGAVTNSKVSDGVKANYPKWVKWYYNGAQLTWTGNGVTNVTRTATGEYQIDWGMDISGCSYVVAPAYYAGGSPDKYAYGQTYQGGNQQQAIVRTYESYHPGITNDDVQPKDYPMSANLVCSPATATG